MKDLYIVEDENYKLVIKASDWIEAEKKAIEWAKNKVSLDKRYLKVNLCDNHEVIE